MRRLFARAQSWYEMQERKITSEIAPPLCVLPDLQIAVARKGDLVLAFKGGHNGEGHNHNDVGSITLYDGKDSILVDVGINTYTRFTFDNATRYTMIPWTRTAYHNLPVINGVEQQRGAEHRTDDFRASHDGMLCSFAAAYPAEAGVSRVTRALELTKNGLQLTDRFAFTDEKKQVREVLMAVLPVRTEKDAVIIGDKFRPVTFRILRSNVDKRTHHLHYRNVGIHAGIRWILGGLHSIQPRVYPQGDNG